MKKSSDHKKTLLNIYFIFLYYMFDFLLTLFSFRTVLKLNSYLSIVILFPYEYSDYIYRIKIKRLNNCLRESLAKKVMLANSGNIHRLRFMVLGNESGKHKFHVRLEKKDG